MTDYKNSNDRCENLQIAVRVFPLFLILCNVSMIGVDFLCDLFLLGNRFVLGRYFTFDHYNAEVFEFMNE